MILFFGIPTEPPIELAIRAAEARGIDHLVVNQRTLQFTDLRLESRSGCVMGDVWAAERHWSLSAFTGVYTRMIEFADLPESRSRRSDCEAGDRLRHAAFVQETLSAWVEVAPCRVVNR